MLCLKLGFFFPKKNLSCTLAVCVIICWCVTHTHTHARSGRCLAKCDRVVTRFELDKAGFWESGWWKNVEQNALKQEMWFASFSSEARVSSWRRNTSPLDQFLLMWLLPELQSYTTVGRIMLTFRCTHTHTHTLLQKCKAAALKETEVKQHISSVSLSLQVLDVCPFPGLLLTPSEGVVPSGGQATLHIHFTPDSVIRFDTKVEVREGRRKRGIYFYISLC